MKFNGLRAGIAAAVVAAAAGVIVTVAVVPGAALPGSPVQATRHTPTPVPSVTVPTGVPTNVPPTAQPPALTLEVVTNGRYGPILATPAGITVYRSIGNVTSQQGFNPLLAVPGQQLRLPILVSGRLGTFTLPDGKQQITFNGARLYLYSGDHSQGDTNGAGAHWRVIVTAP